MAPAAKGSAGQHEAATHRELRLTVGSPISLRCMDLLRGASVRAARALTVLDCKASWTRRFANDWSDRRAVRAFGRRWGRGGSEGVTRPGRSSRASCTLWTPPTSPASDRSWSAASPREPERASVSPGPHTSRSIWPAPHLVGALGCADSRLALQPRRPVIAHTFAWIGRWRQPARDHEATVSSHLTLTTPAAFLILTKRLAQELRNGIWDLQTRRAEDTCRR